MKDQAAGQLQLWCIMPISDLITITSLWAIVVVLYNECQCKVGSESVPAFKMTPKGS